MQLRHRLAHVLHQRLWHRLDLHLGLVRDPILVAGVTLGWVHPVERDQSRRPEVKGVAVEKIDTEHHLHILEAMLMITRAKNMSPRATVAVAAAVVTVVVTTVTAVVIVAATAEVEALRSPGVAAVHLATDVAAVAVAVEAVAAVSHALGRGHIPIHVLA